jgi:hypothetical protein
MDDPWAPAEDERPRLTADAHRARVEEAYFASLARPRTAADRLRQERCEAKERRKASGRKAPPDYLRKTMDLYESRGYAVERTERYDAALKRRFDLFGCVDAVALGRGETVAIQATSWDNVSARRKKMQESKMLARAIECGWKAVVVGWRKGAGGRYEHKEERVGAAE